MSDEYDSGFASYCYDLALEQQEQEKRNRTSSLQTRMVAVKSSQSRGDTSQQMNVAGRDCTVNIYNGPVYKIAVFGEGFGNTLRSLLGGGERPSVRQLSQGQSRELTVRGR